MKTVAGYLSITRGSDGMVRLYVEDEVSGVKICDVSITPENFGNAVTGLSVQECDVKLYDVYDTVSKTKETERITMDRPDTYDKSKIAEAVMLHFAQTNLSSDGWAIMSDGTSTKQPSGKHVYLVRRFV